MKTPKQFKHRRTYIDWREGFSQNVKFVDVETPNCEELTYRDVVDPHFNCGKPYQIHIYPRMNVNLHYGDAQYFCFYSHMKCGDPHCSTIRPHSKCGNVVSPHIIHIVRVKVHNTSTSQVVCALPVTSDIHNT